jgi:hypothetical protein
MSRPVAREDVPWQLLPDRLVQQLRYRCASFVLNRALMAKS